MDWAFIVWIVASAVIIVVLINMYLSSEAKNLKLLIENVRLITKIDSFEDNNNQYMDNKTISLIKLAMNNSNHEEARNASMQAVKRIYEKLVNNDLE